MVKTNNIQESNYSEASKSKPQMRLATPAKPMASKTMKLAKMRKPEHL